MPIVIAQIVALILAGFGAVIVLSKLEKEVVGPLSDDVRKTLEPILNPGVLVLAVAGIFLLTRARR